MNMVLMQIVEKIPKARKRNESEGNSFTFSKCTVYYHLSTLMQMQGDHNDSAITRSKFLRTKCMSCVEVEYGCFKDQYSCTHGENGAF